MRVLIVSDNHHDWKIVEKVLANERFDFSIHLGDAEVSEQKVKSHFDKYVAGNHDFFSVNEDVFEIQGIKFGILHGHTRGISLFSSLKPAVKYGKAIGVDVVLHGHTHVPSDEAKDGIRVICPGALANARSAHGPTYMVMAILNGKIKGIELKQL